MSNLREDIRNLKSRLVIDKGCANSILSLSSFNDTIEKASLYETYNKLFNVLEVGEECGYCKDTGEELSEGEEGGLLCEMCHGIGRIPRELTEEEREEVLETLIEYLVHPDINGNVIKLKLKSGARVMWR
ncbi:MAG: hypothetical protein DDT22_00236 [candidate division WS2 bacterium]|nr:hypothetical protein [Candidatus Lithacetigena glycinireducens]